METQIYIYIRKWEALLRFHTRLNEYYSGKIDHQDIFTIKDSKSGNVIGKINSNIHIVDPLGKNRTELTLEIDVIKTDCLELATKNVNTWKSFMIAHHIVF